ncbi:MAG TPA: addiction module protein [Pirellulaceae bacterium]|nr:addiction module protein [Pirellulaceae bacterium]
MTQIAQRLRDELAQLSAEDRAELAHYLIGSLDTEVDEDAESAWAEELDRRAAENRSNKRV